MKDDVFFTEYSQKPLYIFTEVKTGLCILNGPWTSPEDENMQRVLNSLGAFKDEMIEEISCSLYKLGYYENEEYRVNLVCIGKNKNQDLSKSYPKVPQFLFDDILNFIFERFRDFRTPKKSHDQWDKNGKYLWTSYKANHESAQNFIKSIKIN